jgi:hypothetical protein
LQSQAVFDRLECDEEGLIGYRDSEAEFVESGLAEPALP